MELRAALLPRARSQRERAGGIKSVSSLAYWSLTDLQMDRFLDPSYAVWFRSCQERDPALHWQHERLLMLDGVVGSGPGAMLQRPAHVDGR